MTDFAALAERCEAATKGDNALDVMIELALFVPHDDWVRVRANAAGTKVIYTDRFGADFTFWADDWTASDEREMTVAALRARAAA